MDKRRLLPYALKMWTGNELASKELRLLSEFQEHAVLGGNLVQHMLKNMWLFFGHEHKAFLAESPVSAHDQHP